MAFNEEDVCINGRLITVTTDKEPSRKEGLHRLVVSAYYWDGYYLAGSFSPSKSSVLSTKKVWHGITITEQETVSRATCREYADKIADAHLSCLSELLSRNLPRTEIAKDGEKVCSPVFFNNKRKKVKIVNGFASDIIVYDNVAYQCDVIPGEPEVNVYLVEKILVDKEGTILGTVKGKRTYFLPLEGSFSESIDFLIANPSLLGDGGDRKTEISLLEGKKAVPTSWDKVGKLQCLHLSRSWFSKVSLQQVCEEIESSSFANNIVVRHRAAYKVELVPGEIDVNIYLVNKILIDPLGYIINAAKGKYIHSTLLEKGGFDETVAYLCEEEADLFFDFPQHTTEIVMLQPGEGTKSISWGEVGKLQCLYVEDESPKVSLQKICEETPSVQVFVLQPNGGLKPLYTQNPSAEISKIDDMDAEDYPDIEEVLNNVL